MTVNNIFDASTMTFWVNIVNLVKQKSRRRRSRSGFDMVKEINIMISQTVLGNHSKFPTCCCLLAYLVTSLLVACLLPCWLLTYVCLLMLACAGAYACDGAPDACENLTCVCF